MARTDAQLAQVNVALRALSDPSRLRMLALLAGGEVCVCHMHEALRIPQPTASRHLAYLRRAGLVQTRRDGVWIYYRLAPLGDSVLQTLVGTVTHCAGHLDTAVKDRQRLEKATGCCAPATARRPGLACCSRG